MSDDKKEKGFWEGLRETFLPTTEEKQEQVRRGIEKANSLLNLEKKVNPLLNLAGLKLSTQNNEQENEKESLYNRKFNEQTYLLSNWEEIRKKEEVKLLSENYIKVKNTNIDTFQNQIYGREGVEHLLKITSAQLAFLVPKVRLYKVFNPYGKEPVVLEFPFQNQVEELESILSKKTGTGRGVGVGLDSFEWNFEGTQPAEVDKLITVKIGMIFQSLSSLFEPIKTLETENKKYQIFYKDLTKYSQIQMAKYKNALSDEENYNTYTLAKAMDYGWMFNIPVWGRSGNGYIFDSNYITAEQAKDEVEKFLGREVVIGKTLKFDPGALDRVWIKNCCAIGLSSSFVEPLEATSIGTSIQQAFLLMHRLPNYDEDTIEKYNKDINDILTNLRDFVILHYITKKDNTQFWRDIQKMPIPESLAKNLKRWRKNLPIADDFKGSTDYKLFSDAHYIHILAGLKLFDVEAIKQEYEMMHPVIKEIAENFIREKYTFEKINPSVGHKQYIEYVRNLSKK
jgi:hypothetical protein